MLLCTHARIKIIYYKYVSVLSALNRSFTRTILMHIVRFPESFVQFERKLFLSKGKTLALICISLQICL